MILPGHSKQASKSLSIRDCSARTQSSPGFFSSIFPTASPLRILSEASAHPETAAFRVQIQAGSLIPAQHFFQ